MPEKHKFHRGKTLVEYNFRINFEAPKSSPIEQDFIDFLNKFGIQKKLYHEFDPEEIVFQNLNYWKSRALKALQKKVAAEFNGDVSVQIRDLDYGSLTGIIVFSIAAGVSLYKLSSKYSDIREIFQQLSPELSVLLSEVSEDILITLGVTTPINVQTDIKIEKFYTEFRRQIQTKSFIRFIVALFTFSILALQFPFVKNIFGHFWPVSELRHQNIFFRSDSGLIDNQVGIQLSNVGYGAAKDVFVRLYIKNNDIVLQDIQSDEIFEDVSPKDSTKEIRLKLKRLSPGAVVGIWIETSSTIDEKSIVYSAVSHQGSSRSLPSMEFVDDYKKFSPEQFEWPISWVRNIWNNLIVPKLSTLDFISNQASVLRKPIFWQLIFVVLYCIFLIFLLFPTLTYVYLALIWGGWLISWLFVDYEIGMWVLPLTFWMCLYISLLTFPIVRDTIYSINKKLNELEYPIKLDDILNKIFPPLIIFICIIYLIIASSSYFYGDKTSIHSITLLLVLTITFVSIRRMGDVDYSI